MCLSTSKACRSPFRHRFGFCAIQIGCKDISTSSPSQPQRHLIMRDLEAVTIVLSEPAASATPTATSISSNAATTNFSSATEDFSLQKYFPIVLAVVIAMICFFCLCLPYWLFLRYCRRRQVIPRLSGGNANQIGPVLPSMPHSMPSSFPPSLPPRPRQDTSGPISEMQDMQSNLARAAVADS